MRVINLLLPLINFASIFIFAVRLERRKKFVLRFLLSLVLYMAFAVMNSYLRVLTLLQWNLIQYVACIVAMIVCFKAKANAYIICFVCGACVQHLIFQLYKFLSFIVPALSENRLLGLSLELVVHAVAYAAIYVLLIRRFVPNNFTTKVNTALLCAIAVIILFPILFLHYFMANLWYEYDRPEIYLLSIAYSVITSLAGIVIIFILVRLDKSQQERLMFRLQMEQNDEKYEQAKYRIEEINIRCHDLKHRLLSANATSDRQIAADINEYIADYDGDIDTGNKVFNLVLNEKKSLCKKYRIRLTCFVNDFFVEYMEESELYSVLENAVCNALDAVMEVPEDMRSVSIRLSKNQFYYDLCIENYFAGHITYENGFPKSNKLGEFHGYGIKSMSHILERYGGKIRIKENDQIFSINIFFPTYAEWVENIGRVNKNRCV